MPAPASPPKAASSVPAATTVTPSTTPPAVQTAPPPTTPAAQPSIGDDLEAIASKPSTKQSSKPAKAPEKPKSPDASTPPDEPAKPATEKAEPAAGDDDDYIAAPEPKPVVDPTAIEPTIKLPKDLRVAYGNLKVKAAELEKKVAELSAKPVDDAERKSFTDQIMERDKKLEEALAKLKFAAYEQSDEYREKYEEPFVEAWKEGVAQVTSLTVTNAAGETRAGTDADFQLIMTEGNNERAAQLANEMFGANAFYVLSQRRELQKLNASRQKALTQYRSTVAERLKSEQETTSKAQKEADLAFEGGNGLTPEQRIKLHSAIRNRSAAFGRLVHRLKARDAQIAELEKQVEEFRTSAPGAGKVGSDDSGTPKELTFDQELEAIAAKRG